jgi:hypothetical protein
LSVSPPALCQLAKFLVSSVSLVETVNRQPNRKVEEVERTAAMVDRPFVPVAPDHWEEEISSSQTRIRAKPCTLQLPEVQLAVFKKVFGYAVVPRVVLN